MGARRPYTGSSSPAAMVALIGLACLVAPAWLLGCAVLVVPVVLFAIGEGALIGAASAGLMGEEEGEGDGREGRVVNVTTLFFSSK